MQLSDDQKWLISEIAPLAAVALFVLLISLIQFDFGQEEVQVEGAGAGDRGEPDRPEVDERPAHDADEDRALIQLQHDDLPESSIQTLYMPVDGVTPDELVDSFHAPRGEGRSHKAIDIFAERDTPVRAAVAGTIARVHRSGSGGKSVYTVGPDSAYAFYYAHLKDYAPDIAEGDAIEQGDLLGTVGSTGNAPAGSPHLHFAIWTLDDPDWVWEGDAINPYYLLRRGLDE